LGSFQSTIVADVARVYQSADAATRLKIDRLIQVWLDRSVFPPSVVAALQAALRTTNVNETVISSSPTTTTTAAAATTTTSTTAAAAAAAAAAAPTSSSLSFDTSVSDDVQAARLATQVSALTESMLDVPFEFKARPIANLTLPQLRRRFARVESRRQQLMRIVDSLEARCTRRESTIVAANALVARQNARLQDERRVALRVKSWLDTTNSLIERLDAQATIIPDYGENDNDEVVVDEDETDDAALVAAANRLSSLETHALQANDVLSGGKMTAATDAGGDDKLMQLIETDLFGDDGDGGGNNGGNNTLSPSAKRARVMI
jgi:hypothetical protein